MKPKVHFLIGLIVSLILFFLFDLKILGLIIFFLASFLIDFDHYLYYIIKKKDWNLRKSFNWFLQRRKKYISLPKKKRKEFKYIFCFFHGLEWIIIFIILGMNLSYLFFYLAGGMLLHLILDWIEIIKFKGRFYKVFVVYDFFNKKVIK